MKKRINLPFILIILYIIFFLAIMALLDNKNMQIKLILLLTCIGFLIFSILLKLTGKIYWLTSFDYDDYKNMSLSERSDISSKYAGNIFFPNSLFCIYQLISIYFHLNIILDVLIFTFCLLIMCFTKVGNICKKK
ncbi:MAG: hypothetical protein RR602_09700 [Longicatena sp.]